MAIIYSKFILFFEKKSEKEKKPDGFSIISQFLSSHHHIYITDATITRIYEYLLEGF